MAEKLLDLDAYNLSLGTELVGGGTYLHHTEEVCQVPYRHYKLFPGDVYDMNDKKVFYTDDPLNNSIRNRRILTDEEREYFNNYEILYQSTVV